MLIIDLTRYPTAEEYDAAYKLVWREAVEYKGSKAYSQNPDREWSSSYCTQVVQAIERTAIDLANKLQEEAVVQASAKAALEASRAAFPPSGGAMATLADGAEDERDRIAARRDEKARLVAEASRMKAEHEAAAAQANSALAECRLQAQMRNLIPYSNAWMMPFWEAMSCIDPDLTELARPHKSNAAEVLKTKMGMIQETDSVIRAAIAGASQNQAELGSSEHAALGSPDQSIGVPFANINKKEAQDA